MNLYEIKQEHFALLLELQDADGEISPDLEMRLAKIDQALEDKLEACVCVLKNLSGIVDLHAAEISRLQARKKIIEGRFERLKEWVGCCVPPGGWQRGTHTLKWRKSKSVEIEKEEDIPLELQRVKTEPDKTAIKKELEAGVFVPGAKLVEKQNLQVK